jgi:hypothetical protein
MAFSYSDSSFAPVPLAGGWKDTMDQAKAISESSLPDAAKQEAYKAIYSPDAQLTGYLGSTLQQAAYNQTSEGRKKLLEQQLEFDKARGEQQMKYRMTNDIISNMGKAAYAAFGGGGVPYEYLGQSMANAGNAYLAGRMSGNPAAPVVGQRYF